MVGEVGDERKPLTGLTDSRSRCSRVTQVDADDADNVKTQNTS